MISNAYKKKIVLFVSFDFHRRVCRCFLCFSFSVSVFPPNWSSRKETTDCRRPTIICCRKSTEVNKMYQVLLSFFFSLSFIFSEFVYVVFFGFGEIWSVQFLSYCDRFGGGGSKACARILNMCIRLFYR